MRLERRIENKNRAVGGLLSGEIARAHGADGPARRAAIDVDAHAARPARASAPGSRAGVALVLEGDANDYVGKGLSGGTIVVRPPADAALRRRGQRDRRQHRALRRHRRAARSSAASPASASPSATPARSRWSRASATTAAST